MTPAARYAAAIDVLDRINAGAAAEQALTSWARSHRFAGSKDRAAIRDHVYDILRNYRMTAALGGGSDGRAQVLGLLRHNGIDPARVFGADTYAPVALSAEESVAPPTVTDPAVIANLPDWLWPMWSDDLGARAAVTAQMLCARAGVFLRVNLRRTTRAAAMTALAEDNITCAPVGNIKTALEVIENPRRVAQSAAFADGLVEVQDVAGQAAMLALAKADAATVLDYCAGGGGKSLALADMMQADITAHDIDPKRMVDIPLRAERAGVTISVVQTDQLSGTFDLVLCDAPCSGSGTWRRTPHAKGLLTAARLDQLQSMQDEVLAGSAPYVAPGGRLAYATCSVLSCENKARVDAFLAAHPDFECVTAKRWWPEPQQDGFYLAVLQRRSGDA